MIAGLPQLLLNLRQPPLGQMNPKNDQAFPVDVDHVPSVVILPREDEKPRPAVLE
jgi:hypothetical protein